MDYAHVGAYCWFWLFYHSALHYAVDGRSFRAQGMFHINDYSIKEWFLRGEYALHKTDDRGLLTVTYSMVLPAQLR